VAEPTSACNVVDLHDCDHGDLRTAERSQIHQYCDKVES